jgi:hypothetical protein
LWAFYAIKARAIFFFNACNPTMRNGGFIMDSKKEIYDLIPPQYYPTTRFVKEAMPFEEVITLMEQGPITFPLIAKPDIGLRGSAVKKITNRDELEHYHCKANFDYLLQNLIPYDHEVGIFYVRFPHEAKGRITGIVAKEFLIIEGDGVATMEELLKKNPRYALQLKALQKEYGATFKTILAKGERRNLVPYGNHARGAKFLDYSHLISPQLTQVIDDMCQQIEGFYFGRMDLMYNSWEELEQGKNFAIVELNGAASEPTHIYDPKHSLFFAWKELARHIGYMFQISVENNKKGYAYLPHKIGMQQYRLHQKQFNRILNF